MYILRGNGLAVLAIALVSLIPALPASAQTSDLSEIIVTARKRDESFQNVPITVNVFTEQTIQSAGIESPRDFIAMVPNMTLVEMQNVGNSFITVRGISQARNSEPSVAVLVDGVLETNPYEFDQELFDIQQIEVLKGPQGALYGRNAIGGAIIIRTKDPSDHFEGSGRVGVGNGESEKAQVAVSGPIDSAGTLKYRASVNFYNTDGYLREHISRPQGRPVSGLFGPAASAMEARRINGRADLRVFRDRVETTAYYYVIPRGDEANPFSSFTHAAERERRHESDPDNNLGEDNRDILDTALKLDYNTGYGTFTAITDYNRTREIDTGDAYDFRPIKSSIVYNVFFAASRPPWADFDLNQSQFIDVRAWSQELRFTSDKIGGFSWIAGAYFVHTRALHLHRQYGRPGQRASRRL